MITLTKLEIHNFCTLESVDIDLGPRVFLIRGENRDEASATSNGSGKSLLCQSIVWCLFNDIIRKDMRADDVIGTNDKWTSVCVELTKHNQLIRVERYRNHPKHGTKSILFINGELEEVHTKTDDKIVQILGISSKTLYHFSYSDPDRPPLVSLTPAGVKAAVSEMLDIQRFDDYLKEIRDRLSIKKTDLRSLQSIFEDFGEQMRKLYDKKQSLEMSGLTFESDRKERIDKLEQDLLVIRTDLAALPDYAEQKEQVEEAIASFGDISDSLQQLNKKMKNIQDDLSKANTSRVKAQALLVKCRAAVEDKRKAKANIDNNSSGMCGYCGNALSDSKHLGKILDSLSMEVEEALVKESQYQVRVNELEVIISKLENKKNSVGRKIDEHQDEFKEFMSLQNKLAKIEKAIAGQQKLFFAEEKVLAKIASVKAEKPPSSSGIEVIDNQIDGMTDRRNEIHRSLEEIEQDMSDLKELDKAVSQMKVGIFNNFIHSLYSRIQDYLDQMTGGDFEVKMQEKKGELSFLFSSPSKEGKFWHYNVFSTGERARIRKAVQVALESLVDAGFWIDDEGLDGVDPGGLPLILDFIFGDRVKNKTVFIVSHQTALNDYFEDYPVINVIKENGISRVEFVDA